MTLKGKKWRVDIFPKRISRCSKIGVYIEPGAGLWFVLNLYFFQVCLIKDVECWWIDETKCKPLEVERPNYIWESWGYIPTKIPTKGEPKPPREE